MTKEQILKEITDACVVANPEIRKCIKSMKVCGMIHCNKESHHRIVQLSDILIMLAHFCGDRRPNIVTYTVSKANFVDRTPWSIGWNLKEPLSNQSTETLEFIYKLIK